MVSLQKKEWDSPGVDRAAKNAAPLGKAAGVLRSTLE